jgi:hypothetical protein
MQGIRRDKAGVSGAIEMELTRRVVLGSALGFLVDSTLAANAAGLDADKNPDNPSTPAQQGTVDQAAEFIANAATEIPTLTATRVADPRTVKPIRDENEYLRWRMEPVEEADSIDRRLFKSGETVYLDFGRHMTGYFSLYAEGIGINIDSPARVRFTFGEVPGDVAEDFHPYKGQLAASWLPDEVFNLDPLPCSFTVPRRHAFRYVRLDVLSTSPKFAAKFSRLEVSSVSSAEGNPPALPSNCSPLAREIDRAALATLQNCMQTVFEDGPRRDQRLWMGDLRLQALANYATFKNFRLVKRCLYLLAAFPEENGMVRACVFEKPSPRRSGDTILDYACIFAALLREYFDHTGDTQTCKNLWPTVVRQIELAQTYIGANGAFVDPQSIWIFIDWNEKLHRDASMQGVILFALRNAEFLAGRLGDSANERRFGGLARHLAEASLEHFFDRELQLFVSGPDRQVSWASQAWLTLGGALPVAQSAALMRRALAHKDILAPSTPYLYHYVVEAMVSCGLREEADALIASYWGGMVRRGADTFWEVYDPNDSLASPYGDVHINSFCHAWSCTPAYFFRKFGLGASAA